MNHRFFWKDNTLKILQVHNRYQLAGGEDTVVEAERSLLADNAHAVRSYCVTNDVLSGAWQSIRTALQTHYSLSARRQLAGEIAAFGSDIVHVHNFFPLLTPSIYDACRDAGVPVVQTLHNYRCICPGALLLRNGKICEECITSSAYTAVTRGCYRGSILGTLAVARMVEYHRRNMTWLNKVDRFIALSEFAKSRFVMAGFPEDKIIVKPNFVNRPVCSHLQERQGALFVGRMSPEKGLDVLLTAWSQLNFSLRIAGEGPMRDLVERNASSKIAFLGRLDGETVGAEMDAAKFLVMPSVWHETFGLVIIEAFSHGLPVLASRLGSMTELIEDGVTGLHFEAGNADDLADKVRWAAANPDKMQFMGENARRVYENKFTPECNYKMLMALYETLLPAN